MLECAYGSQPMLSQLSLRKKRTNYVIYLLHIKFLGRQTIVTEPCCGSLQVGICKGREGSIAKGLRKW